MVRRALGKGGPVAKRPILAAEAAVAAATRIGDQYRAALADRMPR